MSDPGRGSTKAGSCEQVLNLLYHTGFRLTGNHDKTAELVTGTVAGINGRDKFDSITALRGLCSVFTRNYSGKSSDTFCCNTGNTDSVQQALLYLPAMERLMVVLRDVVGLTYTEMAEAAGLGKPDVARLLAAGRWLLRRRLPAPGSTINSD